ncbi:MAG: hypothetical protein IPP78_07820 [Holophagaceae bacterium]|nr:hypothetical protein [Holophagaceae bacterium]
MLKLLGADGEGRLWFGLAVPTLLPPLANPPQAKAIETKPDASVTAEPTPVPQPQAIEGVDRNAWEAYLHLGLDRIYCWDPEGGAIKRASWTECWRKLGPPSDFSIPMGDGALRPAAGGFLFDSGTQAWWLPLKEFPITAVGMGGSALPPPVLGPLVVKAPPSPMTELSGLPGTPNPTQ